MYPFSFIFYAFDDRFVANAHPLPLMIPRTRPIIATFCPCKQGQSLLKLPLLDCRSGLSCRLPCSIHLIHTLDGKIMTCMVTSITLFTTSTLHILSHIILSYCYICTHTNMCFHFFQNPRYFDTIINQYLINKGVLNPPFGDTIGLCVEVLPWVLKESGMSLPSPSPSPSLLKRSIPSPTSPFALTSPESV